MEKTIWKPWITVYTETPRRGDDIFILRAIAKYNEGGDPEDVHIRNGLWSNWMNEPLMPYTDMQIRCQASPIRNEECERNAIHPYAYSVGIAEVYPHLSLPRMERQIKVLRKFARDYRYGPDSAEVSNFVQWTAAIIQFAEFLKAQGFVLRSSNGDMGSWDDTPKRELLLFDSESPLRIYNHIVSIVEKAGYQVDCEVEAA